MSREARAQRLILTHLWPMIDPEETAIEGADAFGESVEIAAPHLIVAI
jgi:ribonuclease BN (tRNA processing enzyme)